MRNAEFNDPRLVEVYDAECPWSRDDDFFLSIVSDRSPARVLDLGCGTGRLALAFATAGHTVTGIDPAGASLAAARAKSGAEHVTWIEGTSSALDDTSFDAAVMTSHVAQFFVSDVEWNATLADLRRALVPNGLLAFDSRDPAARGWELWNPTDSQRRITLADGRIVDAWTEITAIQAGVVSFTHHYVFAEGEELRSTATLRFRTQREIRRSLRDAGFRIDRILGGWAGQPVGCGDGELLVIARG